MAPRSSDFGALADTVEVSRDETYRHRRHALFEWQQKFVTLDDFTDTPSIETSWSSPLPTETIDLALTCE